MSPERGSLSDRTLREKNDDNVGHNDQSKDQDKDEEKSEEEIEKEKQDKEDDAEKKAGGGSPLPVGFWDPKLKKVRMEVIKKWCLTSELNSRHKDRTWIWKILLLTLIFFVQLYSS